MTAVLGSKHPRVVELRRLLGRRSSRSADIVLEGPRTVAEALDVGIIPRVVVVPEANDEDPAVLDICDRLPDSVELLVVRDHVFDRLSSSVSPQPMLAVVARPNHDLPSSLGVDDVVLVLIDVGDPGNVGTMIRAADAVSARAVICAGGADPWGDKAVRASAGSVLRVPVISAIEADVALRALRDAGARVVATDVRNGSPHTSGVLVAPVAIVMGNEPHGLDRSIDPLVDAWTTIEMPGRTESLNVAMAATLLLYEARTGRDR